MSGMWSRAVIFRLLLIILFSCPLPLAFCRRKSAIQEAKLVVVTTLPDLADWVGAVGGERVEVFTLLRGTEEPHSYEPKPTDVEKITRARVLVRIGMGLEEWLAGLIENAHNPKLKVITIADVVEPLQDEEDAPGVHHEGNPHIWLDPANAQKALPLLVEALSSVDPGGREFYQTRAEHYTRELDSAAATLRQLVENCVDRKFVAMHNSWPYFCRAFGFELTGVIEPLPGQEPSAHHLSQLVKKMQRESVRKIVTEPHHNRDIAETLAGATDGEIIVLSSITGALPQTDTYLKLLDYNVRSLTKPLVNRLNR